ncbi:MAG: hypothetical protein K8I03_14030 [Ignavibacteria bacterium]|nr:hypothetical protein [Ignavibacteria bacterium]
MKATAALLFTILVSTLYSQTDSVFKFTLPELTITQVEKGKDEIYGFENDRNIFLVSDSLLIADTNKYEYSVLFTHVKKISLRDGTESWRAAKTGGMIGGALGLLLGVGIPFILGSRPDAAGYVITIPASILAGILTGGLIGGVLGSTVPHYDVHSNFPNDLQAKKEVMKKIFRRYSDRF